jgi:hypothetical protein
VNGRDSGRCAIVAFPDSWPRIEEMAASKILALLSALSGFAGTSILFFWTFGFEMPGAFFTTRGHVSQASTRNARRSIMQKIGFGLLGLSFLLNLITILSQ